jgi:valyl-tRNA synthetase
MSPREVIAHFFRDDFCDWYIELSKKRLYSEDTAEKKTVISVLGHVLEHALRLLHPVMPFITEEIYSKLPTTSGSILLAAYPQADTTLHDEEAEAAIALLQELVTGIRNVRAEMRVPPEKQCPLIIRPGSKEQESLCRTLEEQLKGLARITEVEYNAQAAKPDSAAAGVGSGYEFFIPLAGLIDITAEKARLEKELSRLQEELARTEAKLANESFAGKAPADIVQRERDKAAATREKIALLQGNLATLG